MSKGKIVGIIAIKGGVGKTTAVTNLAYVLSNVHKTLLNAQSCFLAHKD